MTVPQPDTSHIVAGLIDAQLTVATGESLTAGLVCARLADVPGASAVVRGGAVCYATDSKRTILQVDADLLTERGPVDADVAVAMADGARKVYAADLGVATTGVAGPGSLDGFPAGLVFVAVTWPGGRRVRRLHLEGDRASIRTQSTNAAVSLLGELIVKLGS